MEKTEYDHQHFEEAAPVYATGGLDQKEREEFEDHLKTGCSVCFDLLKELQPTNQFQPDDPEQVHSDTLKRIPVSKVPPPTQPKRSGLHQNRKSSTNVWASVRSVLTSGVLAVILILVAGGALWFALSGRADLSHLVEERQRLELDVKELSQRMERFQDQIKRQSSIVGEIRKLQEGQSVDPMSAKGPAAISSSEVKALKARLAAMQKDNASLLRKVTEMTEYEAFVQSPRLQMVSFVGKRASDAKGFLLYDPETSNGLFYGEGLPSSPPQTVYQIWALIQRPISLGTFKSDGRMNGRLWLPDTIKLVPGTKFAVSVERGSGAPKPTGDILLLGEMPKSG